MGEKLSTICSVLRGIKNKVHAHLPNRGVGLKDKTIKEIDEAIKMAKRMNDKLVEYKEQKHG